MRMLLILLLAVATPVQAGSVFTYQGELLEADAPADGLYDLRFRLADDALAGSYLGEQIVTEVELVDGLFSVALDFGVLPFDGSDRWLEISVRPSGAAGFTELAPRQQLTSAPYAMHADEAGVSWLAAPGSVPTSALVDAAVTSGKLANAAVTSTKIASMGAGAGQFLRWSGSTWGPGSVEPSKWQFSSGSSPYGSHIRRSGWVGINVTEPQAPLHVDGNLYVSGSSGSLRLGATFQSDGWLVGTGNNYDQFRITRMVPTVGFATRFAMNENGHATIADFAIPGDSRLGLNHDSTTSSAHLRLFEMGFDFARIKMVNSASNSNGRGWDIAGQIGSGSDPAADVFNIYNSGVGDILSVRGSGRVGINRSSPGHPLHVGSNSGNGNGAYLSAGGQWTNGSSRRFKQDFALLDVDEVLSRLLALPIPSWSYRGDAGSRHLGPIAEDFHSAFGLGSDPRYIGSVDAAGVAMAGVQGLNKKLEREVRRLADENGALLERLQRMESQLRDLLRARDTKETGELP